VSNNISKWMNHFEKFFIEIGKSPEQKYNEETETFNAWGKVLEDGEQNLDKLMNDIGNWFESND